MRLGNISWPSVFLLQGHIKGYISHQHQKLVVSKQNPFPPLSTVCWMYKQSGEGVCSSCFYRTDEILRRCDIISCSQNLLRLFSQGCWGWICQHTQPPWHFLFTHNWCQRRGLGIPFSKDPSFGSGVLVKLLWRRLSPSQLQFTSHKCCLQMHLCNFLYNSFYKKVILNFKKTKARCMF